MTTTTRTYRIPTSRTDDALARVAKVNKRLARLGLPLYQVTTTEAPPEAVYDYDGETVLEYLARTDITIIGELPRYAGWEPVAVLVREQGGPVVTRMWPGLADEPNLRAFRGTDATCEHCNKNRYRTDTYVVRHVETGEMKQVGRNCLSAFLGIDVNVTGWGINGSADLDEIGGFAGGADDARFAVADVVATTCAVVALTGRWVSKNAVRESFGALTSTADIVTDALYGKSLSCARLREELAPFMADGHAKAKLVIAHAIAMADTDTSEYVMNLSTVAAQEWVGLRNLPLLASAVGAYTRHEEETVRRAIAGESTWQGSVKDKLDLTVTVESTRTMDSHYGTTTLIVMVDATGNRYKWFASGFVSAAAGDQLTIKGTVKAHDEYRGTKETILTRCKILARIEQRDTVAAQ